MSNNKDRILRTTKKSDAVQYPVPPALSVMPQWYDDFLSDIKAQIIQSRSRIVRTANRHMMMMYYHIGKIILSRQEAEGWGARVIDRLSTDIKAQFPDLRGFSSRNLKYMRKFADTWPDEEIVQKVFAQLPWGHNITLMEKVKEPNRRMAYAMSALEHGWSQSILELQLDAYSIERGGKLPENFNRTLPEADSDMLRGMFKDPYLLDFTGADSQSREKDIEDGLTAHITRFLLELGQGFSYVGRQVHLEIGGNDYYVDMLFYHLRLRCYVVIELKARPFKPEMMGQLAFYQAVVDDTLRHETDNKTIGLLLVKSKNETLVRYSLEGYNSPIGVASWETAIAADLAERWKSSLPTIEELENELERSSDGNE